MDKTINVIIPGAEGQTVGHDATIHPGTTAADVLRAAGKDPSRWQLQRKQGEGFVSLGANEDIFAKVESGEKVFAAPSDMTVG